MDARRVRARGVLLATGGHLLALGVLLGLTRLGVTEAAWEEMVTILVTMLTLQGTLWIMARQGWAENIEWDPHFIYLPMIVSAGLFALYIYVAPEGRYLMLMAWFVSLLFMTGLAGFREVVSLGMLMTALYMGVLWLLPLSGQEVSLAFEAVHAGVFLAINGYAGLVFERLRQQRRETKELREELAQRAVTDPLTGLPNRRYLDEYLQAELARIRRYGGQCALTLIDVDNFKNYNDTLGHLAGDEVLQALADVLQEHLRVSDIAARYGGEEFAVMMVNVDRGQAVEAAERLRGVIEDHDFEQEEIQPSGNLTVSLGVAACPADGDTAEELMREADEALYRAKREGKNRVRAA